MAVVIHEFEVVAEKSPAAEAGAGAAPRGGSAPTPQDVERMLRRIAERLARVFAH